MTDARRILIAAGPTREPVDAVRFLSNRSSGRLGVALAEAARDAGWAVTLLLGPVELAPPEGVRVERFETTQQLQELLDGHGPGADVLVLAAAVSDYRPVRSISDKLARTERRMTLELEPTPDLAGRYAERKRPEQMLIGFALEAPERLRERAAEKLRRKGLDAIVANPLRTMGDAAIDAVLLTAEGEAAAPGAMSKRDFAEWLVGWIGRKSEARNPKPE